MPATGFRYGAKALVTINAVDLSAYCDDAGIDISVATANTTTFSATWETFIEGLASSKFTLKGNFDPTVTVGPAVVLTGLIGGGAKTVVFNPAGTASGELKRTVSAILTGYGETAGVGGKVTFTASFQGTGAVTFGTN
jgi:hypothetical protein